MRLFIRAYRIRVVSFRVRSTPRRPQQNRKESGGRAAPDALPGRRPSKFTGTEGFVFQMVRSTLKLNASISDSKIGGLRTRWAEDQKWGVPDDGRKNMLFGDNGKLLKPESLDTGSNRNSKVC